MLEYIVLAVVVLCVMLFTNATTHFFCTFLGVCHTATKEEKVIKKRPACAQSGSEEVLVAVRTISGATTNDFLRH